jgi:hypothetical protein
MGSGRRLLRNESGSLRDVMNCDRSSLKYTAFRSGIGEDDQPIAVAMVLRRNTSQDRSRWRRPCHRRVAPQPPFWRDASTPISTWSTSEAPAMAATAIGNPWIATLCRGLKRSACVSDIHRSPGVLHRPFVRSAATAFACRVRGRWDRRRCAWW